MQHFSDFSKLDWLTLLPLRYAFKEVRNDALLAAYLKRQPENLPDFLRDNSRFEGKNIVLTIAFGQPRVLDFLLGKASRFVTDAHFLVFDNSPGPARAEIERVCRERKVSYLALPAYSTPHQNRSHGFAMTWVFHNVARALKPRMFAFIDHDLIPFKPVDFGRTLADRPFYGPVRANKSAEPEKIGNQSWSLWAGYCMYDFSTVKELPLNFLYDFSRGLDTGGRNWECLYKNHDYPRPAFADSRKISITDSCTGTEHKVRIVDRRWLHFRGAGYRREVQEQLDLYERMANALAETGLEIRSF
ncbi:MAG TPA: hypothetical protein VHC44_16795 [Verrucomicrobiae bacterium]|nr:hypothetical protein [Verrucomicrobiae bacterium]